MPNLSHMQVFPDDVFQRAELLESRLHQVLMDLPMSSGWSGLADVEAKVFPRPVVLNLDPTCPQCRAETQDGRIERTRAGFAIYYDCGHQVGMSELELEAKIRGRAA